MTDGVDPFLDDLFAFVCDRRLGEVIDAERVMAIVDAALTEPRIGAFQRRFLIPLRERLLERLAASREPLARWLPESAAKALADQLGKPVRVPRWIVDEIVTSEAVRDEVRDMIEQTLADGFKHGGGVIAWGARAAAGAARGMLGRVGNAVQRGLEHRVRDLLDEGVASAQQRIARRLLSKDTARELGRRRRRMFARLLERSEGEAAQKLRGLPLALLDELFAPILRHDLDRPELREAIRAEIEHALAEASKQTIGELLDEHGLRDEARRWMDERVRPLAVDFVAWRRDRR